MLTEDQFSFRKGVGMREAILALRVLIGRKMEKGKETYLGFLDIEKAFDNVDWNRMFTMIKKIGINFRDWRIIWQLYKKETAVTSIGKTQEEAKVRKGVRYVCNLSPSLFNLYIQGALNEFNERSNGRVIVQGERINMLRFADDIAVIDGTEQELSRELHIMEEVLNKDYNLKINIKKTKVIVCSKNRRTSMNVRIKGEETGEVGEFTYLGSRITRTV